MLWIFSCYFLILSHNNLPTHSTDFEIMQIIFPCNPFFPQSHILFYQPVHIQNQTMQPCFSHAGKHYCFQRILHTRSLHPILYSPTLHLLAIWQLKKHRQFLTVPLFFNILEFHTKYFVLKHIVCFINNRYKIIKIGCCQYFY